MDGLDELISELQVAGGNPAGKKSTTPRGATAADPGWDDWSEGDGEGERDTDRGASAGGGAEAVRLAEQELRAFLTDLVDASAAREVEEYLCAIPFRKFMEYYLVTPSLAEYTVQSELDRMQYEVTYERTTTSDKQMILSIFERTKMSDIWRLSNQSIYADAVFAVQDLYLSGGLTVTIHSSQSRFRLDLDASTVTASGTFDFSAPFNLDGDKRHFGSIVIHVSVDLNRRNVLHTVETPLVKVVFDSDLREVAECAVVLLDGGGDADRKYKWFSKIGSIVDARSKLLSQQLISTTGGIMSSVSDSSSGIMEGLVGTLGRWLGADRAALAPTSLTEGIVGSGFPRPVDTSGDAHP